MALASGHWTKKEVLEDAPSPRHGHALTVAGNIAFVFGGCATQGISEDQPIYFNDFHMLTITPGDLTWEAIPQNGHVPCAREGHSLCVVKKNIYLFGGCGSPEAEECIPGMYCFDLGTLMWQKLSTSGIAPRSLKHSSAVVGENIYVFGGIQSGKIADDLYIFNTVSHNWIPVKTTGTAPEARFGHAVSVIGEQMYLFGGCSGEIYCSTVYILDTVTLSWQQCDVKGETPIGRTQHSFTAHHDKDIYLFGGTHDGEDGNKTTRNDVMKLSLAKMKWKMPLYVGVPPAYRYSHTAFVLHSQLFIFGGTNEEKEFNDIMAMRLINPSDRQPIMKEILSEFGIQGVSNGFTPTKVPKVKYELTESPIPARVDSPPPMPTSQLRDFRAMRNQAMDKITSAFAVLDSEFEKLDNEKAELLHAKIAFQQEKEAYSKQHRCQQQELLEMVEKHKTQNEAWLKARAEENDKERKGICKLREEILHDQEKLREEQQSVEKRNQQLLLIMQQFKGM